MAIERETAQVLDFGDLGRLFDVLAGAGYTIVGPKARDGAIHYETLRSVDELPRGVRDEHGAGHYRLESTGGGAVFGYVLGPQSWKRTLHPPSLRLFRASGSSSKFEIAGNDIESQRYAFLGVRPCELRAIEAQDTVFLDTAMPDTHYAARRHDAFIIVANCGQAGSNCFCTSMHGDPRAESGFDLALTEVVDDGRHYFVVEAGSDRGRNVCEQLPTKPAGNDALSAADNAVQVAREQITKRLDTEGLPELLLANLEHPRWDEVAERCLSCSNCTLVCPTCFCTNVEDITELGTDNAERWRHWDSCFSGRFTYIHGGNVRDSVRSRYRQWMTHKLATWHDQFGESGCVGCGRCITWCPVGIDITEEAAAIRQSAEQPESQEATP